MLGAKIISNLIKDKKLFYYFFLAQRHSSVQRLFYKPFRPCPYANPFCQGRPPEQEISKIMAAQPSVQLRQGPAQPWLQPYRDPSPQFFFRIEKQFTMQAGAVGQLRKHHVPSGRWRRPPIALFVAKPFTCLKALESLYSQVGKLAALPLPVRAHHHKQPLPSRTRLHAQGACMPGRCRPPLVQYLLPHKSVPNLPYGSAKILGNMYRSRWQVFNDFNPSLHVTMHFKNRSAHRHRRADHRAHLSTTSHGRHCCSWRPVPFVAIPEWPIAYKR